MTNYKRRSRTRLFTAVSLIIGSFLSAFVLSSLANQSELVWGARIPLIPGHVISIGDIEAHRVALPAGDSVYLRAEHELSGYLVLRSIGAGELVPAGAISDNLQALRTSSLPISVRGSDIPNDLQAGEVVNLYHVGDSRLTETIIAPLILLPHVYVIGVDRKGQNLGGDLSLTLSVNVKNVLDILGATASGRIVVVRVNG
jgi:hypothetical protein